MPPVVNIIDLNRFRITPVADPPIQKHLQDQYLDSQFPYSKEIIAQSYPLPIFKFTHPTLESTADDQFHDIRNKFVSSLVLSDEDIINIENITRGQSESEEWFEQRKGAVTGSKAIRIVNFYEHERSKPENIVSDIMQYNHDPDLSKKVPALAWGHEFPYIRVSPDAVFTCSCHGSKIVEVKCPYQYRNSDLNDIISQSQLDYVVSRDGQLSLRKKHHKGYYEQILMQQALSDIHVAEMLIWSKLGYVTVPVDYDVIYWDETVLPNLKSFFSEYVAAEIITGRVKKGYELYSDKLLAREIESSNNSTPLHNGTENKTRTRMDSQSNDGMQTACPSVEVESSPHVDDASVPSPASLDVEDAVQVAAVVDTVPTTDGHDTDKPTVGQVGNWVLGCTSYCKDSRAPNFSKVKDQLIACDCNLSCGPNTW
ncbi:PREDICTED: uncharacterized protein LOC106812547 [Priapulus caudatus]|uniref:Uncharacterized protein LOC106812547 n=1 Tax=Priapulus caudatus TaxID=37621 RepID=A0ABM1EIA8_PRICU|nr:PREDICTED: uncharacterized protein LOC106812547 [Priapulus caudatus]